jgi:predicted DNA-binding protein (MmcQ/YjbR family)
MVDDALQRLREMCLALPEAIERETWGEATFRVREKIFAMAGEDHGRLSMSCKAPPGAQEVLVGADPARFFVPPYVGRNGWVGVRLDGAVDWDELAGLVADSYRMTAPKRLAARLDAPQRSAQRTHRTVAVGPAGHRDATQAVNTPPPSRRERGRG